MNDSTDREGSEGSEPNERDRDRDEGERGERGERDERDRSRRRLGDSLISSIWGDSSAALKRGQGLVTGVAQGTKEELVRMISAEVRGFLDKMDAADLVQEIVSGLVIEMKTEIRFKRSEDGRIEPDIRTSETKLGHEDERKPAGKAELKPARRDRDEAKDED